MVQLPENELRMLRTELETEVHDIESQVTNLRDRLQEKRDQIRAIDVLMGRNDPGGGTNWRQTVPPEKPRSSPSAGSSSDITPTDAYWVPILEALEERGGREHCDVVLDLVEKKMAAILLPEDYELLPSGISVRWRNRAQWQRQNMVQQGMLTKHSPRGVWEITPTGRAWLQRNRKKAS